MPRKPLDRFRAKRHEYMNEERMLLVQKSVRIPAMAKSSYHAQAYSDESLSEPSEEEVTKVRRKKKQGKRDEDLEGFKEEPHSHLIPEEKLDEFYGKGNWKEFPEY